MTKTTVVMTESEWLTAGDPGPMVIWLEQGSHFAKSVTDRKLRLFACACCRYALNLAGVIDPKPFLTVTALEEEADGRRTEETTIDRDRAYEYRDEFTKSYQNKGLPVLSPDRAIWNALDATVRLEQDFGIGYPKHYQFLRSIRRTHALVHHQNAESMAPLPEICHLLRDIVGNPFRPVKWWNVILHGIKKGEDRGDNLDDFWLTADVLSLAQAAYEERTGRKCEKCGGSGKIEEYRKANAVTIGGMYTIACPACHDGTDRHFGTGHIDDGTLDTVRLMILADALEEAGCEDLPGRSRAEVLRLRSSVRGCCDRYADRMACECLANAAPEGILAHLRSPGPHVRGCWALDSIL